MFHSSNYIASKDTVSAYPPVQQLLYARLILVQMKKKHPSTCISSVKYDRPGFIKMFASTTCVKMNAQIKPECFRFHESNRIVLIHLEMKLEEKMLLLP